MCSKTLFLSIFILLYTRATGNTYLQMRMCLSEVLSSKEECSHLMNVDPIPDCCRYPITASSKEECQFYCFRYGSCLRGFVGCTGISFAFLDQCLSRCERLFVEESEYNQEVKALTVLEKETSFSKIPPEFIQNIPRIYSKIANHIIYPPLQSFPRHLWRPFNYRYCHAILLCLSDSVFFWSYEKDEGYIRWSIYDEKLCIWHITPFPRSIPEPLCLPEWEWEGEKYVVDTKFNKNVSSIWAGTRWQSVVLEVEDENFPESQLLKCDERHYCLSRWIGKEFVAVYDEENGLYALSVPWENKYCQFAYFRRPRFVELFNCDEFLKIILQNAGQEEEPSDWEQALNDRLFVNTVLKNNVN